MDAMQTLWIALLSAALGCAAHGAPSPPGPLGPGDATRQVGTSRGARSYLVHEPPSYDGKKPMPVVVALHGGGSNARQMVRFSGLSEKADSAGFVVVYPEGSSRRGPFRTWNGGTCCAYAMLARIDDVGFIRSVLDDLATAVKVDPKRVYATGISNGGIMAHRLACELPDRIAAIAPVSGTLSLPSCRPARAVPVIHFHGTADEYVKYEGGFGKRSLTRTLFPSVADTIAKWVAIDGCSAKPTSAKLPDATDDGTTVRVDTYGGGKEGSEVVLVTIEGGGHTWPGRLSRAGFLGVTTRDVSANDMMWDFFQRHPIR